MKVLRSTEISAERLIDLAIYLVYMMNKEDAALEANIEDAACEGCTYFANLCAWVKGGKL